jgi:hypothetical protein
MTMAPGKRSGPRTFDPVGTLPPSAGTSVAAPPADEPESPAESPKTKPTRSSVKTSRRQDAKTSEQRLAYTWRLTRDQADQLDRATLAVRDAAGRIRLDRAEMLAALLDQLDEDPAYAKKIARRLVETS